MNIQWYPGHMAKTGKIISENLRIVDVIIELLDARIPISSKIREPVLNNKNKPYLLLLNKSDIADEKVSIAWINWYKKNGYDLLLINSLDRKSIGFVSNRLKNILNKKIKNSSNNKIRKYSSLHIMVIGIPNVGKSTFINSLSGKASAATGDRPGITKGKQWIRTNPQYQLLDTPGILQYKYDNTNTGLNLAFTGAIKDNAIDLTETAVLLLEKLITLYPQSFIKRYNIDITVDTTGYKLLNEIGLKRGCIVSGNTVDLNRISTVILDEFRGGKIGRITLERPDNEQESL
jgi:ribosome biogenesis GTPase A